MRTRLPLIALATALLLTSCGEDSDSAGGGGSEDVLRVATEGTYAPFSFHDPDSNELTGYDVEVEAITGHPVGDRLLGRVAERLRQLITDNEVIGRLGGDEFAVVVRDVFASAASVTVTASPS